MVNFTGIGSGLDLSSLVEGLYQAERLPIRGVNTKKSLTNAKISVVGDLIGKLSSLQTKAAEFDSANELRVLATSSSNEDALTISADTNATIGQHSIEITQLAKAQSNAGSVFADPSTVGNATLEITVGADSVINVGFDDTMSLDDIAAEINSSGARVNASVIDDGTGFRMVITSQDSGLANTVTLGGDGATMLGLGAGSELIAAQDAQMVVDGLTVTRASNTVTDLFTDVTLDLRAETTGPVQVSVANDDEGLREKMQGFVDAYNEVASLLKSNLTSTGEGNPTGPLFGDSTLRSLQRALGGIASGGYDHGGENIALGSVGITLARDGTLSIDASKFDAQALADPTALTSLFAGSSGITAALDTLVDDYTESGTGILSSKKDSLDGRIEEYDRQIQRIEDHADAVRARLERTFTALDSTMAQLQQQSDYLAATLLGQGQ